MGRKGQPVGKWKITDPWLGLYMPEDFYAAPQRALKYHASWGKKIRILSFYIAWEKVRQGPDLEGIDRVTRSGFIPMITWEPWMTEKLPDTGQPAEQPEFTLSEILNGRYENYIRHWALELTKIKAPVFFRPMHEMNGNWYPWCEKVNGNKPGEYIQAWRYIRSIFRKVQCNGLIWVWCPYAHSVPDEPEKEMSLFYPGNTEVDWVGLDGYNWGITREWFGWQSFRAIFEKGYDSLTTLAPEKSFMIAEVGCAEEGGNKANWISSAFDELEERFPRVKALVWFNIDKECDWRIESSKSSLASFKKCMRRHSDKTSKTWQGVV